MKKDKIYGQFKEITTKWPVAKWSLRSGPYPRSTFQYHRFSLEQSFEVLIVLVLVV